LSSKVERGAALKLRMWYDKETSVYGHQFLPSRDVDKIRRLVDLIFQLDRDVRFNMPDEFNWDELYEVLEEFGLKYVKPVDAPVYEDGIREAVGKDGLAHYAVSRNGDLYVFFVPDDYSEFYIFQFTRNDVYLMKIFEKLNEKENNVRLVRDIAREELELMRVAQELMNAAPALSPEQRSALSSLGALQQIERTHEVANEIATSFLGRAGSAKSIIYTETDKHIEAFLVFGKHGIYIVAFAVPLFWWEKEGGWRVLDMLLRRVDPSAAWRCIKEEEGCQLLRELL
ncbi:MAG: hypothetical protein LM580_09140, partial [Thermofilum sp.]|nr:hypothetical protein [Thermofilum sp.]